jgi:hypothetical protein
VNSISPVLTEREVPVEQVIALGQEEYYPIIVARIIYPDQSVASLVRYRFSDKDRDAIAAGADLILSQPHTHAMMPVGLQLAMPNEYPLEIK